MRIQNKFNAIFFIFNNMERPHTTRYHLDVRIHFDENLSNGWIGRKRSAKYLQCPPDFTPLDFVKEVLKDKKIKFTVRNRQHPLKKDRPKYPLKWN